MPKKEVNKLINKMKEQVGEGPKQEGHQEQSQDSELRLPNIDIEPYKRGNAWPGRTFMLIGNSFSVEQKIMHTSMSIKRSACIAMMLEQGGARRCVFVHEAMQHEGFVEVLSKFERLWLNKLPDDTVIGPAYAPTGELIGQSFAVWRNVKVAEPQAKKRKAAQSVGT